MICIYNYRHIFSIVIVTISECCLLFIGLIFGFNQKQVVNLVESILNQMCIFFSKSIFTLKKKDKFDQNNTETICKCPSLSFTTTIRLVCSRMEHNCTIVYTNMKHSQIILLILQRKTNLYTI